MCDIACGTAASVVVTDAGHAFIAGLAPDGEGGEWRQLTPPHEGAAYTGAFAGGHAFALVRYGVISSS